MLRTNFWELNVADNERGSGSDSESSTDLIDETSSDNGSGTASRAGSESPRLPGHLSVPKMKTKKPNPATESPRNPEPIQSALLKDIQKHLRDCCDEKAPDRRLAAAAELIAAATNGPDYEKTVESIILGVQPVFPVGLVASPIINKMRNREKAHHPSR